MSGEDLVTRESYIPERERVENEQTRLSGECRQKQETDVESNLCRRKGGLAVPKHPAKAVIFISVCFVQGGRLGGDLSSVTSREKLWLGPPEASFFFF